MAWASLKANQFGRFKLFHAITLLCALIFLGIKSIRIPRQVHPLRNHAEGRDHRRRPHGGEPIEGRRDRLLGIRGHSRPQGWRPQGLYDLHAFKAPPHEEIRIDGAQIADVNSYGPWHNPYTAIYFTLTGLHALHVIGGALVIGYLWGPGARCGRRTPNGSPTGSRYPGCSGTLSIWFGSSCSRSFTSCDIIERTPFTPARNALGARLFVRLFRPSGGHGPDGRASFIHFESRAVNIAVALVIASVKASLVAGYFMHLISERKMIYCVLMFTAIFFVGLMFLTLFSFSDFPALTIKH